MFKVCIMSYFGARWPTNLDNNDNKTRKLFSLFSKLTGNVQMHFFYKPWGIDPHKTEAAL